MDVKLIPRDPLGRAYTAGMFDGFVYLVDPFAGTATQVFDCETIQPHIDVPVRGGMTQILAMPDSGDRLIFASFQAGQIGMLDVSDPEHPVQSGIVNLGVGAGPHDIVLTDDDRRLIVTDYFSMKTTSAKSTSRATTRCTSSRFTRTSSCSIDVSNWISTRHFLRAPPAPTAANRNSRRAFEMMSCFRLRLPM